MTPEREQVLRDDPGWLSFEAAVARRSRYGNGWSVKRSSADGSSSSVGAPHRTRIGAWVEKRFAVVDPAQPVRTIVDHDAEMRRWGRPDFAIELTDAERASLPLYDVRHPLNTGEVRS